MGILVAGLIAISLFSSFKFRVNNKKLERMRYFIDLNREGMLDEITDEERVEREELIHELYGKKYSTRIYTKEEAEAMKSAEAEQIDFLKKEATFEESVVASEDIQDDIAEAFDNTACDTEAIDDDKE